MSRAQDVVALAWARMVGGTDERERLTGVVDRRSYRSVTHQA